METDPYERIGKRELYRNPWIGVEAHEIVHPNGMPGEHVLIVTPDACAVVVEAGQELLFARQPRFGARRSMVEIVKGGREGTESALECAARELREELGIEARRWVSLGRLYEIPSIVSAPVEIFLASDTSATATDLEDVESIQPVRLSYDAAVSAIVSGELDDAVTIAALFRYALLRGLIPVARSARSTETPAPQVRD